MVRFYCAGSTTRSSLIAHRSSLIALALGLSACSAERSEIGRISNASTLEAQQALVTGAPIAAKRSRFRRHIPARDVASEVTDRDLAFEVTDPPYDFRGSEAERIGREQAQIIARNTKDSDWGLKAPDRLRVIHIDENNDEWEEEYALDDLRTLNDFAVSRGISEPSVAPGAVRDARTASGVVLQGWSNGNDARINKPINATWPMDHNVLMRQGKLNRGCTAALVGRRLVLTALHCLIDVNGDVYRPWYRARQDGVNVPWGSYKTDLAWYDTDYIANNCHITYTAGTRETCGKFDWILLRLRSTTEFPLWDTAGTPGWMGYWLPATSGWFARIDGYPGCGAGDSPCSNPASNCTCVEESVYGQNVGHSTFNWRGYINGEPTIFNTANDISPGHSGGPIWSSSYPDTNGPYVLGIVTNEMCGRCDATENVPANDKTYPTMAFAMTSWVAGLITDKRTHYP